MSRAAASTRSPARRRPASAVALGTGAGPLYRRVVATLRQRILDGHYAVGTQLPAEAELSEQLGVSRHTLREALRQLRDDGLISSRQGSGTTVMARLPAQPFVHEVQSIGDLLDYAASMSFKIHKSGMIELDAGLAARFGAQTGERWLRLEGPRFSHADGRLVALTVVYVPAAYADIAPLVGHRRGALYELIEAMHGLRVDEVEQSVRACGAPDWAAPALGVAPGTTVIEVARVYRVRSGERVQVALNLFPTDRFNLTMKLRSRRR